MGQPFSRVRPVAIDDAAAMALRTGLHGATASTSAVVLPSDGPQFGNPRMANTSSAKKAVRKLARRTAVNRMRRSAMRTQLRKVEEAIASGDAAAAREALVATESVVMRSAQKGVIPANTASRKVSRLSARVKALSAQPAA